LAGASHLGNVSTPVVRGHDAPPQQLRPHCGKQCSRGRERAPTREPEEKNLGWQQRRERGKSCKGAEKKKGVREIETLNKPYGFGSFNNRSHIPLFGFGSSWTEAYNSLWHRFWANRGL